MRADRGLRPRQVAEVIVELPGSGPGRRGSGYLVAPGKVLTAAHVVDGAAGVKVRFQADRSGERTVGAATVEWQHAGIDVAVLALPDDGTIPDIVSASFGRAGETDAVLRCTALGFPYFKLRTDEDGSRFRDAEHVRATCAVLSNRREGTLDLGVTPAPADRPESEPDAWEGMSGAAVFAGGRVVGVVTRHHRADGPGRIAASRVDRWAETLSATELDGLEAVLGCVLRPAALPDAVPADALDLIQEVYQAQLADIAPEQLEGRYADLRDLVEFCGGSEPYRWIQGPPWAGKTALAAWFALHPPRGVVPVWFFVTARYASQSDSEAYSAAVVDQLAVIAGREPAGRGSPIARDGDRRLLFREAAERVAQDGGTLLLVVDGLDEDESLLPGGSGTSIASLLPERLPSNVRVLVTSRPEPGLPVDVKGGHPLRSCPVVRLSATAASRHTEHEAKYDLQQALSGDTLQRDLVGLLTAARGTLTLDDLRELTGEQNYALRQRLGSAFARILRLRGGGADSADGDVTLYMSSRGYLFAHETLLNVAQNELGPDVDGYWERLHAWAESYECRGWPEATPAYLLQPYGRLVALVQDARRAVALATDLRRCERLREATGSDAACLAEIAAAREVVRRVIPDDLGTLAALAAAGELVARRNEGLHPDIPAVYARLGRVRHAIGLARSVFQPLHRATALTGVARVLAAAGDQRAVGLAEEALRITQERMTPFWRARSETVEVLGARGTLAVVLGATGRASEALRMLGELPLSEDGLVVAEVVGAFAGTAAALQDPVKATDLLRRAEKIAAKASESPGRAQAMASIAKAWAAVGDSVNATRVQEYLLAFARQCADGYWSVPEAVMEVLRVARPREVEGMAQTAVERATVLLRHPRRTADGSEALGVVRALAMTGRVGDAESLAEALRDANALGGTLPWADTQWVIASGWAREGRVAEAWAALESSWERYSPLDERSAARVAATLADARTADQLEATLLAATESWQWGVAQAFAALGDHFADDDPERSTRLLHWAERGHPATAGRLTSGRDEYLVSLTGALVAAGRAEEAERLIGDIGKREKCAWAQAVVAVSLAGTETDRALVLAERVCDEASQIGEWSERSRVLAIVVRAFACAGAVDRATETIERLSEDPPAFFLANEYEVKPVVDAVAGLWPCAPDLAGRLVDDLLGDARFLRRETSVRSVEELAQLRAVVGRHDIERGARIEARLHTVEDASHDYRERALRALLIASTDPTAVRHRLDELTAQMDDSVESAFFAEPWVAIALAYDVLGDHEAARGIARRGVFGGEASRVLTALAAHASHLPDGPIISPLLGGSGTLFTTALRLAALSPSPSGPDLPRARALLAEALTPDGWHQALPVMAAIDPDAVLPVRDVVLEHLGLATDRS